MFLDVALKVGSMRAAFAAKLLWRLASGKFLLIAVLLIVAGALAAASLIAQKNEKAGDVLKKLAPYQAYVGIVVGILGLIQLLVNLSGFSYVIKLVPFTGIVLILGILLMIALGVLLSLNFMKTKKGIPQEKIEAIEKKLAPYQNPLGIAGLAVGVYLLLGVIVKWGF